MGLRPPTPAEAQEAAKNNQQQQEETSRNLFFAAHRIGNYAEREKAALHSHEKPSNYKPADGHTNTKPADAHTHSTGDSQKPYPSHLDLSNPYQQPRKH